MSQDGWIIVHNGIPPLLDISSINHGFLDNIVMMSDFFILHEVIQFVCAFFCIDCSVISILCKDALFHRACFVSKTCKKRSFWPLFDDDDSIDVWVPNWEIFCTSASSEIDPAYVFDKPEKIVLVMMTIK